MTGFPRCRRPVLLLHGLGGTGQTPHRIVLALERRGFSVTHAFEGFSA